MQRFLNFVIFTNLLTNTSNRFMQRFLNFVILTNLLTNISKTFHKNVRPLKKYLQNFFVLLLFIFRQQVIYSWTLADGTTPGPGAKPDGQVL